MVFIVQATAYVLFLSAVVAAVVVLTPAVGLLHHPRAASAIYIAATTASAVVIAIHLGAPVADGVPAFSWSGIVTDYFLAMSRHIDVQTPYPFFWSRPWEYEIGGLTWLIGTGGVVMVATGLSARRERTALLVSGGLLVIALFLAGAAYAALGTWHGVAV